MTPGDYERDIRHVALSLEGKDFPFDLGDAVALYPENLTQDVDAAWLHSIAIAIITYYINHIISIPDMIYNIFMSVLQLCEVTYYMLALTVLFLCL